MDRLRHLVVNLCIKLSFSLPYSNRRKVTLDPGLLDDLLNFSDEDESDAEETELSRQGSLDSIISQELISKQNNNKNPEVTQETGSPSKWKKGHQRRHSLTVCT